MEIIPDLPIDCHQGTEVHEVNHPAFQQAWLCLSSFKLQEMGSWLMTLDGELQTALGKRIFLPHYKTAERIPEQPKEWNPGMNSQLVLAQVHKIEVH